MANEEKLREYLRLVTDDLRQTRRRLDEIEDRAREPIAVVGAGCRFPGGVRSLDDLWQLVDGQVDAIGPFPRDRGWDVEGVYDPDPDVQGRTYVREGGFLDDVAGFDAALFGISPREALAMDPQQRVLLETVWQALEDAGIPVRSLRGSDTGVYVGAGPSNYLVGMEEVPAGVETYSLTGNVGSVVSGRVSYTFGLEGPAVTVDTACSSSLVALHHAVRALRAGECSAALVSGVTVLASPRLFVDFSRQRGLAPDARCKPFAAAADGTIWGEGAATVVLEPLSRARAHNRRILGVIRGSAINQDGASSGLTAPNGPAQQRVVRAALQDAGLRPGDVDVVEAHGTGTRLGDPVEAQALLATYGRDRSDRPLWLGSVKSNIGHTAAAAGLAGLLKMLAAMRHGQLPASLHVDAPTPHVDWASGAVQVLAEPQPWAPGDRPRRAAVSAFGISGTNAHVVIEEAPTADATAAGSADAVLPWAVSAGSGAAVSALATALLDVSGAPDDIARSLLEQRSPLDHRAVVIGSDRAAIDRGLRALAAGEPAAGLVRSRVPTGGGVAFAFPGQGAQWAGMGAELARTHPAFADALDECGAALAPHLDPVLGTSVVDVLRAGPSPAHLDRVDVVQPLLWAQMVALARLWESVGVRPDVVVGHSQGEIAAACVAGALSLADGARLVAVRSRVLRSLAGRGAMAVVGLSEQDAAARVAPWAGEVAVAAVNGPATVLVSGTVDGVDRVVADCAADGVWTRAVAVDYASHAPVVDEVRDELLAELGDVRPGPTRLPMHSTVTGEIVSGAELDARYWFDNLRNQVRFAPVLAQLPDAGIATVIEISPHPVLRPAITETAASLDAELGACESLRRDDGGRDRFVTSAAEAWTQGVPVDLRAAAAGPAAGATVALPTYPFQRRHFWLDERRAPSASTATAVPPRHEVRWISAEVPPPGAPLGRWLVVRPVADGVPTGAATACVTALEAAGAEVTAVELDAAGTDRETIADQLPDLAGHTGILSLLAIDERPHPQARSVSCGLAATVALGQALSAAPGTAPLWCVTTGAVAVGEDRSYLHPTQAAVAGLRRAAVLEDPHVWGGLVDLPGDVGDGESPDVRALPIVLAAAAGRDDEWAVRGGVAHVRRIVTVRSTAGRPWTPRGTALVTGGTGALGLRIARRLLDRGVDDVVLVGRSSGATAVDAVLDADPRVRVVGCDISDPDAVRGLLTWLRSEDRVVRTVVHAAGYVELRAFADLDLDHLRRVHAAKAAGAANLDAYLDDDVESVLFCSSITGTWGSADHAGYGSANAFLDALATARRARGRSASSLAWGVWDAGSDRDAPDRAAERAAMIARARRSGLLPMTPDAALGRLDTGAGTEPVEILADVEWERMAELFSLVRPTALFDEVTAAAIPDGAEPEPEKTAFVASLRELPAARVGAAVLDLVRRHTAAVLGFAGPDDVPADRAFRDLGMDSVTAVELRSALAVATGLTLPPTLAFDRPTPEALARFVTSELAGPAAAAPAAPVIAAPAPADDPVAIVGMGCRYPGGVSSPEELWELVERGGSVIGEMPGDRGWDVAGLFDPDPDAVGRTYCTRGGFLDDAAGFDAEFFGISPREALGMDPQQRLLLEVAWEAIERAGLDPRALAGTRTATYVGANQPEYGIPVPEGADRGGYLVTGSSASVLSGRLAYVLGLEGAALTVETACSSSLVALHTALTALRTGECDRAVVAGVAVMASPTASIEFSRQRGLAPDGVCKAFAEGADGMVLAEGVGVLVLERLTDAQRDGRRVRAVVRGSAVNQDGASNGLTAPSGPAQERVIRAAVASAGLGLADVDLVEAHGTGTALGDPIEAGALLATYGRERPTDRPLWLGSVKANIGHTQAAAGVAGVIKAVTALERGTVPGSPLPGGPSSMVDWTSGSVEVPEDMRDWPQVDRPRRAAVSSFGVSGTNAHVVLEQAPETAEIIERGTGTITWTFSAHSESALRTRATLLAELAEQPGADPADVAHALAATAGSLAHRAAALGPRHRTHSSLGKRTARPGKSRGMSRSLSAVAVLRTQHPPSRAMWLMLESQAFPLSHVGAT